MGATVLGLNHVRHAGWGETVIGEPAGKRTKRAEAILELFSLADLEVSFTDDLPGLLWSKLIINVGINALTALTGVHNGQLLNHEGTRAVMGMAVDEATQVAHALGIRLLYDHPVEKVAGVCEATAGNMSPILAWTRLPEEFCLFITACWADRPRAKRRAFHEILSRRRSIRGSRGKYYGYCNETICFGGAGLSQ